ncbi:MAG TPA: EamA/RhaT family transporter, partial [Paracoccaceae bacterium]|nr:EamA/RhaT family transporter [Paracoccaceae bacterium]
IAALRMSEISFVSPFRFSSMFWAILFGYVLFAEVPDTLTLAGIALIFATGVFTMIRERQLARAGR